MLLGRLALLRGSLPVERDQLAVSSRTLLRALAESMPLDQSIPTLQRRWNLMLLTGFGFLRLGCLLLARVGCLLLARVGCLLGRRLHV